ncbi:uncharacterized protein LOC110045684 [Orbicella faveolata]|uniref:uncharacterized protein LOC110045684 n=1 Tax=Orbicella faveolata TaxID=48498 RepID=UPI0009E2ACBB|nr:uncharacterized protein LOC110045684 [Orbicella faveolata]
MASYKQVPASYQELYELQVERENNPQTDGDEIKKIRKMTCFFADVMREEIGALCENDEEDRTELNKWRQLREAMKETTNWERVARKIKDDIQDAFEGIEREDDPEYPKFLNGFLLKGVKGTVDKRHRWHPSLESYEQLRDELKQEENLLPFAEYFVRSLDEGFARYNEYKDKGFSKTFKLGWFTAHWANENGLARPRRTGGTVGSRIEDLSRSLCMAPALSFLFSADSCAGRSTPRNSAFRSFLSGRTFAEHRTSILRQPCRRSMH